MMVTSSRFDDLERRLKELRLHFLPAEFDPTGSYEEDSVYEHARAFRVLTHAEFESFIEDRVLEVLNEDFSRWEKTGETSVSLLAVVAFRESVHAMPESLAEAAQQRKKFPDLKARIKTAKNEFNTYTRTKNHGIKEKNLLRLLMPIGVEESDIDITWMGTTDAWAAERGKAAHTSGKMQVQLDPHAEWEKANDIMDGFRDIDELLESRRKT